MASMIRFRGKSSRTRTQAMSSPNTTFTSVTPTEIVSVTWKDASADGEVTAETKASQPPLAEIHRIAAKRQQNDEDSHTTATPT